MAKYCGDEANIEYEVDANKVGDFANIIVQRFDRKSLTASGVHELKQTKTKMKWPDQLEPDEKNYHGGRQVDFKGLNKKKYDDKFTQQNFTLTITSMDETVESEKTEIIEGYPPRGPDEKEIRIPVAVEIRESFFNPRSKSSMETFTPVPISKAKARRHNIGRFFISFKEGEIVLTVKINVDPESKLFSKKSL